jgi:hypothetical protein
MIIVPANTKPTLLDTTLLNMIKPPLFFIYDNAKRPYTPVI